MIRSELKRCADEIASIDLSMQTIKDLIQNDEKMLQIGTFFIRIYEKILRNGLHMKNEVVN